MSADARRIGRNWHRRARHALAHSLRIRLVALFLLLALAMTAIFVLGMQYALSVGWRDAARPLVVDYVDKLTLEIGSPPSIERAQTLVQRLPLSVQIRGPQVNWRSNPESFRREHRWRDQNRWNQDEPRLFERTTADGHHIQFGLSMAAWNDRPRFIGWATLAGLLLLTGLAYARIRYMLRPLNDIRAGAMRFGAGDFTKPILVRHPQLPDELGELAGAINTMGADIHQMLEAKRTLLLAISHELRSPLTRARLNTELLPETAEVQTSREALLRDLSLMRDLVADLLESERLASPHAALNREPVDMAALLGEVVAGFKDALPVEQDISTALPILELDRTRMRLLLRNLLDNAMRHSAQAPRAPLIRVQPLPSGGISVSVRDFGPGVPEQQIEHLAQPFYRPDEARERTIGGVGLGLYLCKLVVLAHGGMFVIANAHPGLEITVTLPNDRLPPVQSLIKPERLVQEAVRGLE
jgi:signal transduction histidine kinase